jgi:hypothetical protein
VEGRRDRNAASSARCRPARAAAGCCMADMAGPGVVPLENRILLLACGFVVRSRGLVVFVDQAISTGSADSLSIEVGWGVAQDFALTTGNPLVDALMRPGHVVVNLVFGQDGMQMRCAEDQHAVEDLATQSGEEAFAGRVHPGSRDPAESFMRSEAVVASAAGRGHGGRWRRRCWSGRPGAGG